MKLNVADKVFLIVGGTSGMGLATARYLASSGGRVVIAGRDESKAINAAAGLTDETGTDVSGLTIDVGIGGSSAMDTFVDEAWNVFGRLDGLAVTSGTPVQAHRPLLESTDDEWHVAIEEILMGTVRVLRSVIPRLVQAGGGSIVTTSAYSIRDPNGTRTAYTTAKAAIPVLTKDVARRFGPDGIRANCVCPGVIATEAAQARALQMHEAWGTPVDSFDEVFKRTGIEVALGRPGQADEIGEVNAFLLSDNSRYLTGATINVDGGTCF